MSDVDPRNIAIQLATQLPILVSSHFCLNSDSLLHLLLISSKRRPNRLQLLATLSVTRSVAINCLKFKVSQSFSYILLLYKAEKSSDRCGNMSPLSELVRRKTELARNETELRLGTTEYICIHVNRQLRPQILATTIHRHECPKGTGASYVQIKLSIIRQSNNRTLITLH